MSYSSVILADSPTAYWRFGDSSPAAPVDSVGGFTGTSSGSGVTALQTGAVNDGTTSFLFDGSAGNISITGGPAYDGSTGAHPFTFECWFKCSAAANTSCLWNNNNNASKGVSCTLTLTGLLIKAIDNVSGQTTSITYAMSYADSAWHHCVMTISRTPDVLKLYIDGSNVATQAMAGADGGDFSGQSILKWASGTFDRFYAGYLDECALYNTALSAARVSAHFAAASPAVATFPGLFLGV